jgi:hypothetical protein
VTDSDCWGDLTQCATLLGQLKLPSATWNLGLAAPGGVRDDEFVVNSCRGHQRRSRLDGALYATACLVQVRIGAVVVACKTCMPSLSPTSWSPTSWAHQARAEHPATDRCVERLAPAALAQCGVPVPHRGCTSHCGRLPCHTSMLFGQEPASVTRCSWLVWTRVSV